MSSPPVRRRSKLNRRLYLWFYDRCSTDPEAFTINGVRVVIPRSADPVIRYLLARNRPYEAPEAQLIRAHVPPGSDVIELGGCLGVVSAIIRDRIGPNARHIVVEAVPELADICRVNAQGGAAPGVSCVIQAAIDYSGKKTVTFARGHNAHVEHIARPEESGIEIPTTTLSKLSTQISSGPFALVCDIEGHELALFEHEEGVLSRVSVLVLETHLDVYPKGQADLESLILRLDRVGLKKIEQIDQVYCFSRKSAN